MLIDFWNFGIGTTFFPRGTSIQRELNSLVFYILKVLHYIILEFFSTVYKFLLKWVLTLIILTFIQWGTFILDHILSKGRHRHVKAWRNAGRNKGVRLPKKSADILRYYL